jgi:cell division protein FtsN
MADENGSYDLDEDSSLEKFEEELLHEEKKKARSNFLLGILVLLVVGVIGFYGYTTIYAPTSSPPPNQAAKAVKPPAVAPEPVAPEAPVAEKVVEEQPFAPPAPAEQMEEIKEEPLVVEIKVEESAPPADTVQMEAVEAAPEPMKETSAPEMMTATPSDGKSYTLQAGFYRVPGNAERMSKRLSDLDLQPRQIRRSFSVQRVKVYAGEFLYKETATQGAQEFSDLGFKPVVALTGPGKYELEMGSFDTEAQADSLVKELEEKQIKVRFDTGEKKIEATAVRLENIDGTQRLEEIQEILKRENIDFYIIRP